MALVFGGPFLLLSRGRHYLPTLKHRLGFTEPARVRNPFWIHAVSVGEAAVAARLAESLPEDLPLLVTTVTPTGQARARALLGHRAQVTYLPFEIGFSVRRFFDRYQPSALILTEGDLWPLVLREADARGIPIAVVSGRISDRSFARLQRLRRFLGPLYDPVQFFGMQSEDDRRRLLALGIEPERLRTTGNLKFEIPAPELAPELGERIEALAAGRPILVAGSTMRGEERWVLEAFEAVAESSLLVLAPRHPERWNEVAALVAERGFRIVRRSSWQSGKESAEPQGGSCQVLLLDSLGELAGVYRLARGVFVGGTLVPTGGHNPLEPALVAASIAAGPSMENFREMEELFDRARAWRRVGDARELGEVWASWVAGEEPPQEGERARELVEANRGSLERTLEMLRPLLEHASARQAPK